MIRQMIIGGIPDNACCFATGGNTLSSLRHSEDLDGSVSDGVTCFSRNGMIDPMLIYETSFPAPKEPQFSPSLHGHHSGRIMVARVDITYEYHHTTDLDSTVGTQSGRPWHLLGRLYGSLSSNDYT
ncbi:hypothetical protein N7G274_002883 [Stereocaulon virgatum]|uniref:Uncharacterized protein n=1 Tax=Stereocaulon virgatum TaxID=373712 RepID=A0ABR4AGH3_9LECA